MEPDQVVGRNLREWRTKHHLTQQDVANVTEMPRVSVSAVEHGTRHLTLVEANLLGEAYGCPLYKLCLGLFQDCEP